MEIFYVENKPAVQVEWEVTRGRTSVREDFAQSEIWCFLMGENGLIPISVENRTDNKLSFGIPMEELDVGSYGLKLIWVKNGSGSETIDQLLACNKKCVTEVFDVFGISESQYAETNPNSNITFHIKSSAATYGYDGLSAYERAYMLGKTTKSESEWLEWLVTGSNIKESIEADIPFEKGDSDISAVMKNGYNTAEGDGSHSGGGGCYSEGSCSFTHGYELQAHNNSEAAFGQYNESFTSQSRQYCTLFTVGFGDDEERRNAFEIRQDGSIYIMLNGEKVQLQQYLSEVQSLMTASNHEELPDAEAVVGLKEAAPFVARYVERNPYYYGSMGSWKGFPIQ